jgi:hypothetical protein
MLIKKCKLPMANTLPKSNAVSKGEISVKSNIYFSFFEKLFWAIFVAEVS